VLRREGGLYFHQFYRRFWRREWSLKKTKISFLSWGTLVISIGCIAGCSSPMMAQTVGDPAKAQMQEMNRREIQLNNISEKGRPNDPKRAQALMDQVSEDFQRLLTRHNELVRAIATNQSLDYQFIAEAMGEIRKRSTRLQSALKFGKPEAVSVDRKTETLLAGMETKDEMVLLCKTIESFVKNPIIEKPGTVDARALEKARKDLQSIVELSEVMKKQADKRTH
jgi:cellobiose-specific phosphotransferase system component IIB